MDKIFNIVDAGRWIALPTTILFASLACAGTAEAAADKPAKASEANVLPGDVTENELQALIYAPWTKFCLKGQEAGAKQVCFTGKDGRLQAGQPVIAAVIIEPDGEAKKILRVTLPLGMQLVHGTRIIVDSKPVQAPYVICFQNGCMSDYEVTPELVANLKSGKSLFVQAINSNGKPLNLPLPIGAEFAKTYEGPPTDPKVFEEMQAKLQEELKNRQKQAPQTPAPSVAAAPPAAAPPPAMTAAAPIVASPQTLGRRVALIIGNSSYRFMPKLTNPGNDAVDVEKALKGLGFETVLAVDLDRNAMNAAVSRFSRSVSGSDVALVYYSGHGMQFEGKNYLLPTDANLESRDDVNRFQLMPVDDVIDVLASSKGLQLIVLDACRNNPVERDFKNKVASVSGGNRNAGQDRGFSRIDARSGLVVTFATSANKVASDGTDRNSPFTKAFLKNVSTPDIEVREMLNRVQRDVFASTAQLQLPEITSQYVGPDIRLKPTASK